MTQRALIAVAEGVDDLQTVTLVDVLRQSAVEVLLASVETRRMLTCARGTRLTADAMLVDVLAQSFDLIVLPGGENGARRLAASPALEQRMQEQVKAGQYYAAIGESPALVLQAWGLLRQRRMTCHNDVSQHLSGCSFVDQAVVVDGNCITAQHSAAAIPFALALVELLEGKVMRGQVAHLLGC
ncbi:DJ-1 family glyoxalase III [Pseudomonas japonica]|uniref:DJ-1 family glyoxalase III n=1 Tax=Pseudomonas TaxID=286 RepID=UPI0029299C40|nr:DJ-1 family glyoxalase III [Pseudomonas sp. zfem002]MDU9392216.1 DJ-1/PfpI family protein [Pseudomonas sp. zfem002]